MATWNPFSEDGSPGRKDWIDNRLKELDRIFAISVGGVSIMDNHIHFLLRIDLDCDDSQAVVIAWLVYELPQRTAGSTGDGSNCGRIRDTQWKCSCDEDF